MLESLFNKTSGLQVFRPATLVKKSPTQVFFCEYCGNIYFEKHLQMDASVSQGVIYVPLQ